MLSFWCEGCESHHGVHVTGEHQHKWGWNGSYDRPTFTPSVLVRSGHYLFGTEWMPDKVVGRDSCWCTYNRDHPNEPAPFECTVCHSFVTDGSIQYLNDCTHKLSGQKLQLRNQEDDMKYLQEADDQTSPGAQAADSTPPVQQNVEAQKEPEKAPNPAEKIADAAAEAVSITNEQIVAASGTVELKAEPAPSDPLLGDFVVKDVRQSMLEAFDRVGLKVERLPEMLPQTPPVFPQPPKAADEGPLHGTGIGVILGRIRTALADFEGCVASEFHDEAREAHAFILDSVNELRGHFRSS